MNDINIVTNHLIICNKIEDELDNILMMYNDPENYFYATGIKKKMKRYELIQKLSNEARIANSFFAYVKNADDNSFVGYLKGHLRKKNIFWLSILMVEKNHIHKGLGSKIVSALEQFLKANYNIKKIYISVNALNTNAIYFWRRTGYKINREIQKKDEINNEAQLIYIYLKHL